MLFRSVFRRLPVATRSVQTPTSWLGGASSSTSFSTVRSSGDESTAVETVSAVESSSLSVVGLDDMAAAVAPPEPIIVRARKKDIKGSPFRLNELCRLVRGLPVIEAKTQMVFSKRRASATVWHLITNAANNADILHGIPEERLYVKEAHVGKGKFLKRMEMRARGRVGVKHKGYAHLTVFVEELPEGGIILKNGKRDLETPRKKNPRRYGGWRRKQLEATKVREAEALSAAAAAGAEDGDSDGQQSMEARA